MKTKSNKIRDIITYINDELENKYSQNEIKAFTNILFEFYANMNSSHLLAFNDETVNESTLLNIVLAINKLTKYVPIQYILGHTEFCGLDIKVSPDVLIPRPETEELTQIIIKENTCINKKDNQNKLNILDLCTGSGCIALALNKFIRNSSVFGIDVSEKALNIAKQNNRNLNLNVAFAQIDLLHDDISKIIFKIINQISDNKYFISQENSLQFDIIVSNPPYIPEYEKVEMKKNVLNYEPSLALFVKNEDPLIFYKKIAILSQKYLKNGGKIYLESNHSLIFDTLSLFSQKEYVANIRKDIFNRNRFIFLQKKHQKFCQETKL
ncbi:MAG: peptide chain release factor N(5)-glutamine methyltransferase [Bacteroidales bacterium]